MPKTREQIQALKDNWRFDPCFDLEDTEGFEEHRAELSEYASAMKARWDTEADERAQAELEAQPAYWLKQIAEALKTNNSMLEEINRTLVAISHR